MYRNYNYTLTVLAIFITDEFFGFCEYLKNTEIADVVEEIWTNAFGRYDRAMKRVLEIILGGVPAPVKKLVDAVVETKTPRSSKCAADAIQKGYCLIELTSLSVCREVLVIYNCCLYIHQLCCPLKSSLYC